MSGFQDTSIYPQLVLLIAITNAVFLVSGFGSSCWQQSDDTSVSYGLWFRCTESTNRTLDCVIYGNIDGQDSSYSENLSTVRALESTGYICLCLCCAFNFVYICTTTFKHKAFAIFLTILSITSFGTMIAGIVIYGNRLVLPNFTLGWSFALTVLASIFCVPIAVFQTMEIFHKYAS